MPPYLVTPTYSTAMSPYKTEVTHVVSRFCTSNERKAILAGLLNYRKALRTAGLFGFQWLAGSFIDEIEKIENRHPNDIDVVTFFHRPAHLTPFDFTIFFQQHSALFDPSNCKVNYRCDAHPVDLNASATGIVDQVRFWFGLFSHRRISSEWKGLLQVPLTSDAQDDVSAESLLNGTAI